jgi:hypothetical protein
VLAADLELLGDLDTQIATVDARIAALLTRHGLRGADHRSWLGHVACWRLRCRAR